MNNFANITGSHVFNLGTPSPSRPNFRGVYAHSSLRPVATYVQRSHLETQIRAQLTALQDQQDDSEARTVVIWGLGGAGKSQLALQFVQANKQHYQAVFWIDASQKETIERDYVQIYKQLGSSYSNVHVSPEDAVTAVKSWLQGQEKRCLWVMDGADEIEDDTSELYVDLHHYLPEASQLDRIVTTRSARLQDDYLQGAVAVTEMSEDEAVRLFARSAKVEDAIDATKSVVKSIVRELGYLALAVTLAGSYVGETPRIRSNLSLYIEEYQSNRKRLLSRKARQHTHRYSDSVLTTWEVSFGSIRKFNAIAAQLLTLLSFINFDDISPLFFRCLKPSSGIHSSNGEPSDKLRWLHYLSSNGTEIENHTIETSFAVLQAHSLISWQEQRGAYAMHKLVHAWGYDRLEPSERHVCSLAVLELLNQLISEYEGDMEMEMRIVPHAKANVATMEPLSQFEFQMLEKDRGHMDRVAELFHRRGRWDDEYQARMIAYKMSELELGGGHPITLFEKSCLASVLVKQERNIAAEEMCWEILRSKEQIGGLEHGLTAMTMNTLGTALVEQGKYDQAEAMYRRGLEIAIELYGGKESLAIACISNLALISSRQGRYEESEQRCRETIALAQDVLGPKHTQTITSMDNLAAALCAQGKYDEAEEIYRRDLAWEVFGSKHPRTIAIISNLALVLACQGRYEESEERYNEAIDLAKEVLGPNHPTTIAVMNDLGKTFEEQGKLLRAEEVYQEAASMAQK